MSSGKPESHPGHLISGVPQSPPFWADLFLVEIGSPQACRKLTEFLQLIDVLGQRVGIDTEHERAFRIN